MGKEMKGKKLIDYWIQKYGQQQAKRKYEEYKKVRKYKSSQQYYIDKFGYQEGKKKYQQYLHKTKFIHTKQEYIERYGEIKGNIQWEIHKNDCVRTLQTFIKKYGKNEGKKRWNNYCKKQAQVNTFQYKHKKYGMTKQQFDQYNKSRAVTLQNLIKKYGQQIGKEKWEKYCQKQKYTKSKQYLIKIYGKQKGLLEYKRICSEKALTKENFIRKYGKINGQKKFKQYIQSKKVRYSKQATKFFDKIAKYNKNNDKIFYGENEQYFSIFKDNLTIIFLDFYNENTKKGIQFYGDFWHGNPLIYQDNDFNPIRKEYYKNIKLIDEKRIKYMKQIYNIDIKYIWESDSNNQNQIKELIQWVYTNE